MDLHTNMREMLVKQHIPTRGTKRAVDKMMEECKSNSRAIRATQEKRRRNKENKLIKQIGQMVSAPPYANKLQVLEKTFEYLCQLKFETEDISLEKPLQGSFTEIDDMDLIESFMNVQ